MANTRPVDPEVYEHYLKGRQLCNTLTERDWYRGIDEFRQAVDRDPSYGPAHAGLARCYGNLALFFHLPSAEAARLAEAAVAKALELWTSDSRRCRTCSARNATNKRVSTRFNLNAHS